MCICILVRKIDKYKVYNNRSDTMIVKSREDKKSTHVQEDIHDLLTHIKAEKKIQSIERTIDMLLQEGIRRMIEKDELPEYISVKFQEFQDCRDSTSVDYTQKERVQEKIEYDDIDDLLDKFIESSGDWAKDKIIVQTKKGIEFLRDQHGFKQKHHFMEDDVFEEDKIWRRARTGFEQLEEKTGLIEIDDSKYKWKG